MVWGLRLVLVIIGVLLMAKDFQFVLKFNRSLLTAKEPMELELLNNCGQSDPANEKEEENKEENTNAKNRNPFQYFQVFAADQPLKTRFHDQPAPLPEVSFDLESPPPEI